MNLLEKIQNLPELPKKIILWSIVFVIALVLFFWWIRNFQQKLKGFQKEEFIEELKIPSLEQDIIFPELEIPKLDEKEQ
ncbi:hypothetical protein ACFL0A_01130 [Patescibacteria group bacterium]